MILWLRLVLLALLASTCQAYDALVVFPVPTTSHRLLGDGFVRHLVEAGHEVTYITPYQNENNPKNLHRVIVNHTKDFSNLLNMKALMDKEIDMKDQSFVLDLMNELTRRVLGDENVQKLLNNPKSHFDVIVAEWMYTEVYSGFSAVFNCPYILFFPFEYFSMALEMIDEVPNPAFTPNVMASYLPPFSFSQRVAQLWQLITEFSREYFYNLKAKTEIYKTFFGPAVAKRGGTLPPFEEIRRNASFVLTNSHVSLGSPTALPQNYINIGGYHIDTNLKPLPVDLQKIMDNSKDGVIYFSMGSVLKSRDLPDGVKRDLLKMFSALKQTVLWKFEEVIPDLPKNVHMLQWAPQTSILAHRNCVLFITHGGFLSTIETVHFGVPVIGIPVFADQFLNVNKVVNRGFARRVDLTYNMAEDLKIAIDDVINNPRYRLKISEVSLVYHDRVASPGRELVHWVEHAVRTRGAPHLRSPALMVPWYQKCYLDLAAVLLGFAIVIKISVKKIMDSRKISEPRKKTN